MILTTVFILGFIAGWIINDYFDLIKAFIKQIF